MINKVTLRDGNVFATGNITSENTVQGTTFVVSDNASVEGSVVVGTYLEVTGSSYNMLIESYTNGELPDILIPGRAHDLGELTANVDLSEISFPAGLDDRAMTCEIWFSTGDTPYSLTLPQGIYIGASRAYLEAPRANSYTRVALRKEGTGNLVISVAYEYPVQS